MHTTLLLPALSFLTCLLLTPIVRAVAVHHGFYDLPGELKIHSFPTPRLGGVAMMGGLVASAAVFSAMLGFSPTVAIVLGGIWVLGLIDDLKGTPALVRLAAQLLGGGALWIAGWRLEWFSNPYGDLCATALFFAFVVNAMNFVDGMDGLALTIFSVSAAGFIALFAGSGRSLGSGLSWVLLAVCIALLIYNFPPARIFIGDSGSTLAGAILAVLCLEWVRSAPVEHSSLIPMTFLGLPLGDMLATVVRRLRKKTLNGDRRHFYDLLRQKGWSVKRILAFSFFTTSALVLTGLFSAGGAIDSRLVALIIAMLFGICAFLLGSLDPEGPATGSQAATAARNTI